MTNLNSDADSFDDLTADPNNWRFYRYRVYERVIPLRNMLWGTTGMKSSRKQDGVVLFVALIVLIIMTLAGLALLRQMGVGTSIAGNIAFKENATSVADRGTEFANAWLVANYAITASDSIANGYISNWGASVDPNTYDWDGQARIARRRRGADRQQDPLHHPSALRVQGPRARSLRTRTAPTPLSSTAAIRVAAPATRASFPGPPRSRSSASRPGSTGHATRSASPKFWCSNGDRRPK